MQLELVDSSVKVDQLNPGSCFLFERCYYMKTTEECDAVDECTCVVLETGELVSIHKDIKVYRVKALVVIET